MQYRNSIGEMHDFLSSYWLNLLTNEKIVINNLLDTNNAIGCKLQFLQYITRDKNKIKLEKTFDKK